MRDCPACGTNIDDDDALCPACGAEVDGATSSFEPVKSPEAGRKGPAAETVEGPVLVVRKGPQPGERFFIDCPKLTIGRDPHSDIFLNDMTVSRAHAVVEQVGSSIMIKDSGSLNGTYVNGALVDTAELAHGDSVQIGTFQMVFYCTPEGGRG